MSAPSSAGRPEAPVRKRPFVAIKALVATYVVLGVAGIGVAFLLRDHPQLVDTTVWVRSVIVLVTSALLYLYAERASRGSRAAFTRVRIISIVVPVAIAVLVALPDPFPLWMKVQQGLCALAVVGVAVLVNRTSVRRRFAR